MRATLTTLAATLLLGAGLAPPAVAADTHTIDTAHSHVAFQIRHLVSKVRGEFTDFEGTIVVNLDDLDGSSVNFGIAAASIDTRNTDRDNHLRSGDFFDVESHPSITFASRSIREVAEGRYLVTGDLTMRGVTKSMTLPVEYLGSARDPWGNTKGGFSIETTLNRQDFGISWNKALDQGGHILGDEVTISIELETQIQAPTES